VFHSGPSKGEGVVSVCTGPVLTLMNPPGIFIISETNMLIRQLKTFETLPHPLVATVVPTRLETNQLKDKYVFHLMLVPCIIRRRSNNQHNALICTTALFYMLPPTCFGSSLPSSWSFWTGHSYGKIQIGMVVYHIMWLTGLCVGVSWFSLSGKHNRLNHDTPTHRPLNHII
jgi:hypothetical protein